MFQMNVRCLEDNAEVVRANDVNSCFAEVAWSRCANTQPRCFSLAVQPDSLTRHGLDMRIQAARAAVVVLRVGRDLYCADTRSSVGTHVWARRCTNILAASACLTEAKTSGSGRLRKVMPANTTTFNE